MCKECNISFIEAIDALDNTGDDPTHHEDNVDQRLDKMDQRLDKMEKRLDKMEEKLDAIISLLSAHGHRQAFTPTDDPKPNNQFQCETCNDALAPICCVCNQKIQSGTAAKRYKDRHYHIGCFRCCKCNAVVPDGHNFVDMLDGRFQCLTCSHHITGSYQGKEHAPHLENALGEIVPVQCDQAGRIPICDKCARPVSSEEDAFKLDTRYYHLECARCNRCRKKLLRVPCRNIGSALVCHTCS